MVARGGTEPSDVPEVDHAAGTRSTVSMVRLRPQRLISSVLSGPLTDPASALSRESPVDPTELIASASSSRSCSGWPDTGRPIGVMDEAAEIVGAQAPQGHPEGELGMEAGRHRPADDRAGEDIDEEGSVREAGPGPDIGQVRHPRSVGSDGEEDPLEVGRALANSRQFRRPDPTRGNRADQGPR
jgi:hypothetical protein